MSSFNAWVSVAVPYSSVPQMYNVLLFLVPEQPGKRDWGDFEENHTHGSTWLA